MAATVTPSTTAAMATKASTAAKADFQQWWKKF